MVPEQGPSSPVRCLLVATVATAGTGLLLRALLPHLGDTLAGGVAGLGFEALLVAGCEAALAACAGWLWILTALVLLDATRGRALRARRGVPPLLRRLVLAACGLSLAGSVLGPAHAEPGEPDHQVVAGEVLVGLAVPDRMSTTQWLGTVTSAVRRHRPADVRRAPRAEVVVVRPGDTLWTLAAHTLPPGASAASVDRRWREIYRANRPQVGPDPHLILPGQRLHLPHPGHRREEK